MKHLRIWLLLLGMISLGAVWAKAQDGDRNRAADRDRDQYEQSKNDAYQSGLREGREDAQHNRRTPHSERWRNERDRRDYEAGYNRGYDDAARGAYGRGPSGSGYGGESFGQGRGGNSWTEQARQIGYQDGLSDGSNDRRTGHSFRPTHDDNYKNADRGYSSRFGERNQYKQYYRQGYAEGYPRGYNQYSGGQR